MKTLHKAFLESGRYKDHVVKWSRGRKPLGTVIENFDYRQERYVVVAKDAYQMIVCRVTNELLVVEEGS